MNRKERVKAVYELINAKGNNEQNFHLLYSTLLDEFELEMEFNSDMRTNIYLNNLRQTRDKQAAIYLSASSKSKQKFDYFKEFVSHFRHDTIWAAI